MKKIETEEKITLLEAYIKNPRGMEDIPVLKSIKTDVLKANTKGVSKASNIDNSLYNSCMGSYREFMKSRDTQIDMTGRKGAIYSNAMRNIIDYIRRFQKGNNMPHSDQDVLQALQFIFKYWGRLSPFHQKRILLSDIYGRIEEIISQLKNGHDKTSSANSAIEQRKQELAAKRQQRHS